MVKTISSFKNYAYSNETSIEQYHFWAVTIKTESKSKTFLGQLKLVEPEV
jgi:hypothetical protein